MRIALLEAFGIDDRIIDLWKEAGHEELLPIQQIAVRKGKILDGKSAVIFSPTSSGKTFVGEMAAVQTARQNRRAIYLVPQKALAEEKYQEFTRKYGSFGVRVVISTRDRTEFDRDIYRGNFHIAVVVFEKMQALMVASPALLRNVGLVVVDELQMIGDKTRGAGLEILITKILLSEDKPQIIGLSAVLGNAKPLADWMGAELCEDGRRPVELRKGVLHDGIFHYVEHNSGRQGEEKLDGADGGDDRTATLVSQVRSMAEKGEQCLVFCKSKNDCIETARVIAERLKIKPADQSARRVTASRGFAGEGSSDGATLPRYCLPQRRSGLGAAGDHREVVPAGRDQGGVRHYDARRGDQPPCSQRIHRSHAVGPG